MTQNELRKWYKENEFTRQGNNHVSDLLNVELIWSKHPYLTTGKWLVKINGNFVMSGKNHYRQFNSVWDAAEYVSKVTK